MAETEFSLRRGDERDVETLVRHRRMMWEEIGGQAPPVLDEAQARYRQWIPIKMRSGDLFAFIVKKDGARDVASGCVWLQESHPRPAVPSPVVPRVLGVYTEREYRRRGLATMVVKEALALCMSMGFKRVALTSSEEGRRLYQGLGFRFVDEMWLDFEP